MTVEHAYGAAIDPGLHKSALVLFVFARDETTAPHGLRPLKYEHLDNADLLEALREHQPQLLVIETIPGIYAAGPFQNLGRDQLETERWGARFHQQFIARGGEEDRVHRVSRSSARTAVTGTSRANDSAVRQALIDLYGGQEVAVGGRKCKRCSGKGWRGRGRETCNACAGAGLQTPRGPLHGWTGSHGFAALACGLTWAKDQLESER